MFYGNEQGRVGMSEAYGMVGRRGLLPGRLRSMLPLAAG